MRFITNNTKEDFSPKTRSWPRALKKSKMLKIRLYVAHTKTLSHNPSEWVLLINAEQRK